MEGGRSCEGSGDRASIASAGDQVGFVIARWLFVLVIGVAVCDAIAAGDPVRHDVKKGKQDTWLTYSDYARHYRLKHPPDWKPHVFKTRDSEFLYFFETAFDFRTAALP